MELIPKPNEPMYSINEVIDAMAQRLHVFQQCSDHRAVFQRVYLLMTKEMQRRLESAFFNDPVWMERVLIGFAQYYFDAMDAFEAGKPCSPAWELAFQQATSKRGFVLQDALLGINAHINNDLPLVLYRILEEDQSWPDARIMLKRRLDHERINDVLEYLLDQVQDELTLHYARFIGIIDRVMGRKDESLSSVILTHFRTRVWNNTEFLLNALDDHQRKNVQNRIEREALDIGQKVAYFRTFRRMSYLAPITRRNRWF
ncbi:DUF5995 family protein [Paenibacillus sp. P36]|uniref:DUF5995 family protein n=1 Tax=Paenibacillus sp. P36 TaxID=3342538 RepID=UPI0038B2D5B8